MKEQPNIFEKKKKLNTKWKDSKFRKNLYMKILCRRNCRRKFIRNLLLEKRKENMQTKQSRFKSRLKN